jgi:hypothetical protein
MVCRVDQDGQGMSVNRTPDRFEKRVNQVASADCCHHHDADGALTDSAVQFGNGQIRVLPRERGEPANAVRVAVWAAGLAVIYQPRGLAADGFTTPENSRRTERYNREVYSVTVHLANFGFVIEGLRLQRAGGHAFFEQILFSIRHLLCAVMGCAVRDEKIQVRLAKGVGMYVDDGRHVLSPVCISINFAFDFTI